MFAFAILAILALQPSPAGEEALIWTELPDPDPNYVPPPSREELGARRAEQRRPTEMRRTQNEYRLAEERAEAELRNAEQTIRNTCETLRQAIGQHPACSR